MKKVENYVVLSLFDGASCGQMALREAGVHVEKYMASEIKKVAIDTTLKNFPNTAMVGDVTKLHYQKRTKTLYANCTRKVIDSLANHQGKEEWTKEELKKFSKRGYQVLPCGDVVKWIFGDVVHQGEIHLLIGGSPCQGFSSAHYYSKGKDTYGLKHEESKLFFEYLRLLKEVKPRYFFLENVKMEKKSEAMLNEFMGVKGIHINSNLLSFQNRYRIYWTNIPNITIPQDAHVNFQDFKLTTIPRVEPMLRAQKFDGDTTPLNLTQGEIDFICKKNEWAYEELKAITPTLTKEEFVDELHCILKEACCKQAPFRDKMWHGDANGKFKCKNLTHDVEKVGCLCLVQDRNPNSGIIEHGGYIRLLSRLEICRAQTIPYRYMDGLSYRNVANLMGDSWTLSVITHIFKNLK